MHDESPRLAFCCTTLRACSANDSSRMRAVSELTRSQWQVLAYLSRSEGIDQKRTGGASRRRADHAYANPR